MVLNAYIINKKRLEIKNPLQGARKTCYNKPKKEAKKEIVNKY